MRRALLAGVFAGQEGEFTLTGDESLTPRPMERVAAPLRRMGAIVETTDGHAPLVVHDGEWPKNAIPHCGPRCAIQPSRLTEVR